ncbi:MAG: hypothetical protein NTY32_11205 [Bacteroidia bacterium]|nr:hypothetical protein [Bacteroidia bacterium]
MREYGSTEKYTTAYTLPTGEMAPVFASANKATVMRHIKWVRDYNTDGVFLQRFISEYGDKAVMGYRDQVTAGVKEGCEKYGRVFSIMYDGLGSTNYVANLKLDWMHLVDDLKITNNSSYLNHNGLPLVSLWGYTVRSAATCAELEDLIEWFHNNPILKYRASIKLGVNDNWFSKTQDWLDAFAKVEVISPWSVGRYSSQSGYDNYIKNQIIPGMNWCTSKGLLYVPVIFPGFSWYNLKGQTTPQNEIPRAGGSFYWLQSYGALLKGAKSIYIAMFDEVDEGTAVFKTAENESQAPAQRYWLNLNADGIPLPSDWYLRCAGKTADVLKGNRVLTSSLGAPAQGIMTIRYTENCGLTFIFPDFPGRSTLEISLDGGITFPYSTPDNLGTFTINGLSGTKNVFVRHPDLSPVPMGEIKLAGNCITAIDDITNDEKLIIYPQPATDVLYIKHGLRKMFSYRILDSTGRNVQEGSCENHSISVNNLNSGLYFLVVGGCSATKFVVEKD